MTIGPGGKYDDVCEALLHMTGATTTAVIVIDGKRGTGFSVSTRNPSHVKAIATALRDCADQLDADAKALD